MINELEKKFKQMQFMVRSEFDKFEPLKKANVSNDEWSRPEGGGGQTYVIADGDFFDNCAINFSSIFGKKLPEAALARSLKKEVDYGYRAMGVSVISHPVNPHVPTSHMNVRLFGILDKNNEIHDWWMGGGYDLTPFIPYEEDIVNWHKSAKDLLNGYDPNFYSEFAQNCNNYFNIVHRKERRGVGGIFFDNLSNFVDIHEGISFLTDITSCYIKSYLEIAKKREKIRFSNIEKEFQLLRRGRYAEFNLVYDRGTTFGLQSNGRIESILASLPSNVKWSYNKTQEYKDLEAQLLKVINRDWNV